MRNNRNTECQATALANAEAVFTQYLAFVVGGGGPVDELLAGQALTDAFVKIGTQAVQPVINVAWPIVDAVFGNDSAPSGP